MWVNNANGNLMISSNYLKNGDRIDIYLDLIHELAYIKQFMEGIKLLTRIIPIRKDLLKWKRINVLLKRQGELD